MPLTNGTRIGVYDVTAKIGEGGMGEVYRARDTRLDRDVALKVLPEAFTADPDRLARFEREAKVLASLNHPNIAGIHGLEESDGVRALALELVEGPTLADRIARGPIPLDEALPVAKQIAEALEAAHEQGIVHRDLKPANIKVREDGTVKVLDFGLAKAVVGDQPGQDLSQSPTITATIEGTREGVILGTAAYMSPEQARGQAVDKRTDIWAFGCVLFEMLTGRAAFAAESLSDTIAAVLTREVDLDSLPGNTPAAARRLVRRCLERDPGKRLRHIQEGLVLVEEELSAPARTPSSEVAARGRLPGGRLLPMLASVTVASLVTGVATWYLRPTPEPTRDVFTISLPPEVTLPGRGIVFTLSPDGRDLIYVGQSDGVTQLYHRPLDRAEAAPIAGTVGAETPFFSPDGLSVGFKRGDTLRKVRLAGGASEMVAELPPNPTADRFRYGVSWSDDDTMWFGHTNTGLYRVSAAGGDPLLVTEPGAVIEGERAQWGPTTLSGGRGVLYTAGRASGSGVALYIPETGEHRVLSDGGRAWFASSGHVVFARPDGDSSTLWAVPFDPERLEAVGDPVLVREGVRNSFTAEAHLSEDGTLAYLPNTVSTATDTLVWVSRDGSEEPTGIAPRFSYGHPRLSPDGARLVVNAREAGRSYDLFVFDLARDFDRRITDDPGWDWVPLWTPDGLAVIYACGATYADLCRRRGDGTGAVDRLLSNPERGFFPFSWSRDGRHLLFSDWDSDGPTGFNISTMSLDDESRGVSLLTTEYAEVSPAVSPNGRLVAYASNESGRHEVYVRPFPGPGDPIQVSIDGGLQPLWSPDGRELFYRQGTGCDTANVERADPDNPNNDTETTSLEGCDRVTMMTVPVEWEPTFVPGRPVELFDEDGYRADTGRHYDVAEDGRFLMVKQNVNGPREITVVRNWVEELAERVPRSR